LEKNIETRCDFKMNIEFDSKIDDKINKINSNIKQNIGHEVENKIRLLGNIFNEHINLILNKINKYGIQYNCIISSDCHKTRPHVKKYNDEIYKYPLFNTSGNPFGYFSSKQHKNQYSKKIILSNSGKLAPFYDDGILGTTQDSMYILVNSKKEANVLITSLNSTLFTFIIKICQWGNFRNEASLFTYLKYPDFNIIKKNDDKSIMEYYKLNKQEILFINKNCK
jgi:hypothetical protein